MRISPKGQSRPKKCPTQGFPPPLVTRKPHKQAKKKEIERQSSLTKENKEKEEVLKKRLTRISRSRKEEGSSKKQTQRENEAKGKGKRENQKENFDGKCAWEIREVAPWYDEAISALHMSQGQTKRHITINASTWKMKRRNFKLFLSCHIDKDRNKGATDKSKK